METCKKHHSSVLPLKALNHVSRVCYDVRKSAAFYRDVLGFIEVKRPSAFEFEGSWLFGYCFGVHLIKGEPQPRPAAINPKADHLSFQSDSLCEVRKRLRQNGIEYVEDTVLEDGIRIHQIFFHDPENNMIEICNCDCLLVEPLSAQAPICTRSLRSLRDVKKGILSPRPDSSLGACDTEMLAAYYPKALGLFPKECFGDVGICQSTRA